MELNNKDTSLENVETSETIKKVDANQTKNVDNQEERQNGEESKDIKKNNLEKVSELAQVYSVVTQGFFMMLVVALIGFAIGKWGMKSDIWAAILAVFGTLIGLVIFISLLWRLKIGGLGSDKQHNKSE